MRKTRSPPRAGISRLLRHAAYVAGAIFYPLAPGGEGGQKEKADKGEVDEEDNEEEEEEEEHFIRVVVVSIKIINQQEVESV